MPSRYRYLVYTTQVNSAFRAIWLVPRSEIHLLATSGGKKWRAKPISSENKITYLWIAIKLVLYILKQLFASVSVNSGGYLPRRSGPVNIHRYSPPLRRMMKDFHEGNPDVMVLNLLIKMYVLENRYWDNHWYYFQGGSFHVCTAIDGDKSVSFHSIIVESVPWTNGICLRSIRAFGYFWMTCSLCECKKMLSKSQLMYK